MLKLKSSVVVAFTTALLILLSLILLLPGILSMRKTKDEGIKYVIGVSQTNLMNSWQLSMNYDMRDEVKKSGDTRLVCYDSAMSDRKQEQDIDNLVKQRVDLLIILPGNAKMLEPKIAGICKSGTPVIVLQQPLEADYSMLIYTDNKKIGKLASEYAKKLLGSKGGTILEVQGDPESPESKDRKVSFTEGIKESLNITKEYVVVGYWTSDKTYENIMENDLFCRIPKINLVFAHNDPMAMGAKMAAQERKAEVKVIGVDGLPGKNGGLEEVQKGRIDATILYPTGGKEAIRYAEKILRREEVPGRLELQPQLITKDNADQFILK